MNSEKHGLLHHWHLLLTVFDVWVPLSYGDDIGEGRTEPLGVDEVEVTQSAVSVVDQDSIAVEEAGGLV